jgi:hypothetical protein
MTGRVVGFSILGSSKVRIHKIKRKIFPRTTHLWTLGGLVDAGGAASFEIEAGLKQEFFTPASRAEDGATALSHGWAHRTTGFYFIFEQCGHRLSRRLSIPVVSH